MAYNYGPPPGAYQPRQQSYPFAGAAGAPGMGPPPGMSGAPGVQAQSPQSMQNATFQPPPNMPNINFNAPVIRLGVDSPAGNGPTPGPADRLTAGQGGGRPEARGGNAEPLGNRNRAGLGSGDRRDTRDLDRERAQIREGMIAAQPPTREEIARTIFVGGLGEGAPDDAMIENMLRCMGKLRRWTRARDADEKLCKFGFAEYEDVDSLEAANEVLPGTEIPVVNKAGFSVKDESEEVKKMPLLVVVDEQSKSYIDEWKSKGREDDETRSARMESCKAELQQCLESLIRDAPANGEVDVQMTDGADGTASGEGNQENGDKADVLNIAVELEDELSDVPAEMRATIAEEIRAFRDRSNRRDLERLRQEEEMEQQERQRSGGRVNRLASPEPPTGPSSGANGVPAGPRERGGPAGAPSGPKGYRGAQMPSDYVNGVSFVGENGATNGIPINREDDDAEESDEDLERQRRAKREAELEAQYERQVSRWTTRERNRLNAQERERTREASRQNNLDADREKTVSYLQHFDDDAEAKKGQHLYFRDRSAWLRMRRIAAEDEERADAYDRRAAEHEQADAHRRSAEARGMADDFLAQTGLELEQRAAEQQQQQAAAAAAAAASKSANAGFKISLGSAAARTKANNPAAARRAAVAEVENLLDDDEEVDTALTGGARTRPELRPLAAADTSAPGLSSAANSGGNSGDAAPARDENLSDDERAAARQALAATIPTATADLFAYPVRWNYLSASLVQLQIRPFVERKVVEFLGVQEDLLVETVLEGLQAKKEAKEIVAEVEGALEEDAEALVRKCWRVLVFATESEARGLN